MHQRNRGRIILIRDQACACARPKTEMPSTRVLRATLSKSDRRAKSLSAQNKAPMVAGFGRINPS